MNVADHPVMDPHPPTTLFEEPEPRAHAGRGESTTELLGGLVADARDLAVAHLDHVQLEVKQELHNLAAAIKARAIAMCCLVVASLLVAQALAFALAALLDWPIWAGFAVIGLVVLVAAIVVARLPSKAAHEMDLVPEHAIADVARDAKGIARKAGDAMEG